MSAEATRMQDLASKFSQKFPGVIPPEPHSGRGDPLPHSPQPGLWPGWGECGRGSASTGRCWDPNLGPPQLFSVVAHLWLGSPY